MVVIEDDAALDGYAIECGLTELFTDFPRYRRAMTLVQFERGEYIYVGTNAIHYLYFVVSGKVMVYVTLSNGKSQLLNYYNTTGLLGDLDLFNRANPYITVQATADTLCVALDLTDTRPMLMEDSRFLVYICETLCDKLSADSSNNAMSILSPLEERLASYILVAGERRAMPGGERLVLEQNLTEVADLLACSYRHLQRTLHTMVEAGILAKKRRLCVVLDEDRLRQLVNDSYMLKNAAPGEEPPAL